jgi:ubiquinone/menaquinone biosynthesis C-methylase UbiE
MIADKILRRLRANKILGRIPTGSVVCDLGCGKDAYFLKESSQKIRQGYGFDIGIKDYVDANIELREIDLNKGLLPLADESVDAVTMLAVLEHLDNPGHIIKEAFRVLKKGGIFFITTPGKRAKKILEILAFRLKVISKKDILDHKHYFSPAEIENLLVSAGFRFDAIKRKYFELGLNIFMQVKK